MEGAGQSAPTECGVGSIVWVRRRNGSWWPGKILGPEELPASQLTSPRTGTPVKLLGREDASVDWYNLEKSKRVKAFRCGEFDDCIERAEGSQGMAPKKREKYARREDAILHALELEKEMLLKLRKLEICHEQAGGKSSGSAGRDSGDSDNNNDEVGNAKPDELLSTQETFDKGVTLCDLLASEKKDVGNPGETTHRMRGLEELGLKTTTEQKNLTSLYALDSSLKSAVNDTEAAPGRDPSLETASHMNGKISLDKRKRQHEGLTEEILAKKRDRSRPLVQVLQSSAKLEGSHILQPDSHAVSNSISGEQMGGMYRSKGSRYVCLPAEFSDVSDDKEMHLNQLEVSPSRLGECNSYPFSGHLVEDSACEFMGNVDSGASAYTSSDTESESDSSETEPDLDEEMTSVSGSGVPLEVELDALGRLEAFEDVGSISTGESNESSLSGDLPHFYPHDPLSVNEAVSKWRLKGKRNMRNLAKRTTDANFRCMNKSIRGMYQEEKGSILVASLDNVGYPQTFMTVPRGRNGFSFNRLELGGMSWDSRAAMRRHWETAKRFNPIFTGHRHFPGGMRPMLIDVDLKVQASYQKPPVPIVSLMSKLDGKAIIGHPIQIEPLEDGSSERLVPASSYFFGNGLISHDGSPSLPPTWRTARRTNFRVPRLHLPSALASDETGGDHFLDRERTQVFKKFNVGAADEKTGAVRKNMSHTPRSSVNQRLQRKLTKKVSSSSSSLRTKALSSIGMENNVSTKTFHSNSKSELERIIKRESGGPPTVACIPVKLVFSRLLEKINRPASKAKQSR